jgi:hypothetical protein
VAGDVEAGLAEVCGELNAAHGRLVELVAQALETRCWEGAGIHSAEQWVAWQTGLSPGRAGQIVHIARRRNELPATIASMGAGALSVDQVAVVVRHTPAAFDSAVAGFAGHATVVQLRRALRRYHFDTDSDTATAAERPPSCSVSSGFGDDGRYRLRAVLDADDGALVDAALRQAHDRLFHDGGGDVSWVDALVEVAHRSLATVDTPARRDAFRAVFHVDTGAGQACAHGGPVLPASLRRQLLCDTDGVVVGIRDGRPLQVGRTTRLVPLALRRLVEERDGGCRVPGCTRNRVQLHHVVHWEDGGPTTSSNLVALCHRHHRLHHQGRLGISGDADRPAGLAFTTAAGHPLSGAPPPTPPASGHRRPPGHWTHPTGERLHTHWLHFQPCAPATVS